MISPFSFFDSLTGRVLVLVLPPLLFALLLIAWAMLSLNERNLLQQVDSRLEQKLDYSQFALDEAVHALQQQARSLAGNDLVMNGLIDTEERYRYLPTLFRSLGETVWGDAPARYALLDFRGQTIISNHIAGYPDMSFADDRPWVSQLRDEQSVLWLDRAGLLLLKPVRVHGFVEGWLELSLAGSGLQALSRVWQVIDADVVLLDAELEPLIWRGGACVAPVAKDCLTAQSPLKHVADYTLRVGLPQTIVVNERHAALLEWLWLMLVSLVVALVAVVLATRLTVRPLDELARAAEGISSSADLGRRLPDAGPVEVRTLARALNDSLDQLEASHVQRSELEMSEAKFRSLFELSPVGIAMNDLATGEFLDFNAAIHSPAGYTREEFRQLTYWQLTPKEYMPQEQEQLELIRRNGRYGPFQKEYIRKDGSRYPVLLHGFKTTTPDGREVIWSIIQDITDIERTRQDLELARNQFAALVENIPGITFRCRYDDQWTMLFMSRASDLLTGYDSSELINNNSVSYGQLIHPEDAARVERVIAEAVVGDRPWEVQYRVRHRDGSIRWAHERGVAVFDEQGTVAYLDGFILDVTQRMEAERELAESRSRLDAFFAQSVSGFFFMMLDEPMDWQHASEDSKQDLLEYAIDHQRMTKINQAMLDQYGATEEQFIGLTIRDLFAHDLDHAREIWRQLFDQGRLHVETREQRLDGTPINIDGDYICLYDEQGRVTGHFGVQHDVTERKRQRDALQQAHREAERASRAKSEFLANMSHEIRTPMNAVIGLSQLLEQTDLDKQQRDQLRKINQSSRMLLRIINDILDFSKIEAGQLELEARDFKLGEVVEQMATLFGEKAHAAGLELLYDIQPDLPRELVGDSLRLSQVLGNLLSNATKFTERGGTVELGIRAVKPVTHGQVTLRFHVRDTGIGMSEEQLARLFRPFSQADTSTTRKYGGTGLGLVITRRLVEAMGSELEVTSVPDEGSTFAFTLTLPLGRDHRGFVECPETTGRRVLIVDDQASARQIMRELLHHCRYFVEEADSGEAAVEQVVAAEQRGEPFDFILLDWMMPGGMNGGETCEALERLRQRGELKQTRPPILMVSAYAREEITLPEGLITDYLAKPLTASSLYDALVRAEGGAGLVRAAPADRIPDLSGRQLLLVEDNELNQEVARRLLEKTGARVQTAGNGAEAIEAVAAERPDLILMDLQMPVMDGFEATRRLRAEGYEGPIVALSAAVMDDDRRRAREAGVDDHLAKPIERADLYAALARHLDVREWILPLAPHDALADGSEGMGRLPDFLPGFDLAQGRRHLGGEDAVYARLLRRFRGRIETEFMPLVGHLRAGRIAEAGRLAHSLKGLAGTLAATTLHALAEEIDQVLHQSEPVATDLIDRLERGLLDAKQALSVLESSPVGSVAGSAQAVATLRRCLEGNEFIEESLLQEALGYLRGQGLDCDELEARLEQMEFEHALQCLDALENANRPGQS